MPKHIDVNALRRDPQIRFYFRYTLHSGDFFTIRANNRVLGRATAKPLYGRLTPQGRVDRSRGFNGQIAIVFLPAHSRGLEPSKLLFTRIKRQVTTTAGRRRNWNAILAAAAAKIKRYLREEGRV